MEEKKKKTVDEFLIENGYDITLLNSDKDKIEVLRNIAMIAGVDKDLEEINYERGISKISKEEFINNIHNFELKEMNALSYVCQIKYLARETRKLKRKQSFQKIKSIFVKR